MILILILLTLFLFALVLFSNWCMDSLAHKKVKEGNWLDNLDIYLTNAWFSCNEEKYWWIPAAFCDAWHFFKMFMVGGIIAIASLFLAFLVCFAGKSVVWVEFWKQAGLWFVALSVVWNFIWWIIYDKRYKT